MLLAVLKTTDNHFFITAKTAGCIFKIDGFICIVDKKLIQPISCTFKKHRIVDRGPDYGLSHSQDLSRTPRKL
jgi:hypothetical protein